MKPYLVSGVDYDNLCRSTEDTLKKVPVIVNTYVIHDQFCIKQLFMRQFYTNTNFTHYPVFSHEITV